MGHMGAKSGSGVYQAIIALMPPHDTYIEPFAGSGAIVARKAAARRSIVLDKDPAIVDRLRSEGIEAFCADALEYLARLDVAELGRVVLYADPPYVLATRTSDNRYRHELDDSGHRRLAEVLHRLAAAGVAVILSGYPCALYDAELFPGWNTRQFQAMTRGGVRTEKLWFNFEPGAAHWSTFAGKNRTDRQRIKRKAARWAAKWARLPPAEAQAVLAAILEAAAPRAQR
jgi:site-specific DNA-adenine methylase